MVDHGLGPLKADQKCLFVPVCDNDTTLSKPTFVGRSVLMTVRKPTLYVVVQLINIVLLVVKRVDIYVKQMYLKVMLQTKFIV